MPVRMGAWMEGTFGPLLMYTEVYNSVCPHPSASLNTAVHRVLFHVAALSSAIYILPCSVIYSTLQDLATFMSGHSNI